MRQVTPCCQAAYEDSAEQPIRFNPAAQAVTCQLCNAMFDERLPGESTPLARWLLQAAIATRAKNPETAERLKRAGTMLISMEGQRDEAIAGALSTIADAIAQGADDETPSVEKAQQWYAAMMTILVNAPHDLPRWALMVAKSIEMFVRMGGTPEQLSMRLAAMARR